MAVFSTNQNRQLYVALGYASTLDGIKTNKGYVTVNTDKDGCKFINQNGHGGIVVSDLIDPKSIMWATASAPEDTEMKLKAVTLTLNSNFNSGNLVSGEDYILRINFRQMYGMSDEDIYQKYGAVHVTSAMVSTPALFWKAMIYSLIKNFSRLYQPLLDIGTDKNNIVTKATKDTAGVIHLYTESGTEISNPTALYIAEKSQVGEWALGTKQLVPVYFEVIPTTVTNATGEEGIWGTVTPATGSALPDPVPNGYKFADLEYFCMGERGDQYRMVGWPKVIKTNYFITDPDTEWYCLDIHYAYQGTCEDIQKSEKTVTIISETKATIESLITELGLTSIVCKTANYTAASDNNSGGGGNSGGGNG